MEASFLALEESFRQIVCTIFLAVCAVQDLRSRKISVTMCGCAFFAALVLEAGEILTGRWMALSLIGGLLPGAMLLLLAFVSGGAAGTGDGICFLIAGILLGTRMTWILMMWALMLASVCGGVLLLMQRAGRKTRMPFLAFTAAAWAGILAVRLSGLDW